MYTVCAFCGADIPVSISGCFWNCRYDICFVFQHVFDIYCEIVQVTVCVTAGKLPKWILLQICTMSQKTWPLLQETTLFPTI